MLKRQTGYYWVKDINGYEYIARWVDNSKHHLRSYWNLTGTDNDFYDDDFIEIGEEPILKNQ